MNNGTPIAQARGLCFSYQQDPVLQDVNFAVNPGDFLAVIGSNGAGKSTLLRLLLGELSPDRGEILLMGTPIPHFHSWPSVGYVPQGGTSLAEGFPATVAEVVGMGLYHSIGPLRVPGTGHRRRIREALAAVGMEALSTRPIGRLSGGQTQRVLIARALVGESCLLILDEPTTGVDGDSALALYQLLGELNASRGLTVIMVTHDLVRSCEYTNRTLCLEHGSMVELDKAQIAHELEHRHHHP